VPLTLKVSSPRITTRSPSPVLGLLLDLEDPNAVVWLRSFPSLKERDRMKTEFYEGPEWTLELEELAMPMIDRWEVVVAEAPRAALEGSLVHDA
jgi:hypothetical protein